MTHSRLLLEEHALEVRLHNDAAEVVVVVRHIDGSAHRKGHHEAEEAAHEHPESRDMELAYAIEVVEANVRRRESVHDLTKVAAVVEDTPDFHGEHCLKDYRLARRRKWNSLPY